MRTCWYESSASNGLDALALAEADQRAQVARVVRDGVRREPALRLQVLEEARELSMNTRRALVDQRDG